jgi:DNA-binding NarL/FixJ family response regulator
MNKLDTKTRTQILAMLCEGASMRSVSRLTDTSINTVSNSTASRFVAGDVFLLARLATRAAHEGFRQGDREPSADGRD